MVRRCRALAIIAALMTTLFLSIQAQMVPDAISAISPETRKMLAEVCAKSENPSSCVETLSRNHRVSSATAISSIAKIALAAVRKDSHMAQMTVRKALRSNPGAGEALRYCLTFGDTIKELVVRNGDFEAREASLNVHYALDRVVSCESAMAQWRVNIPSVKNVIHKWKDMFNIAYFAVTDAENAASGGM